MTNLNKVEKKLKNMAFPKKSDWRKTMYDGWTNDKNLNKIRLRYEDGGIYSFNLYDENWKPIKIKNFPFHKGKKSAIKFTKQYIKKN